VKAFQRYFIHHSIKWHLLYSSEDCGDQSLHSDIGKQYWMKGNEVCLRSFSAVFCFQEEMSLRFLSNGRIIKICNEDFRYGDLCCFGADTLHGGAANTTGVGNYRFIIHVQSKNFIFSENSQHFPIEYNDM